MLNQMNNKKNKPLHLHTHKKTLISIDTALQNIHMTHKKILINLNTLWFLCTNKIQFQVIFCTPPRTHRVSGQKSQVLKPAFLA